jgi:hypothetical protein
VRDLAERLRNGMIDINTVKRTSHEANCFTGANSNREGTVAGADSRHPRRKAGSLDHPRVYAVNHVLRMKAADNLGAKHPGIIVLKNYTGEGNRD